MTKQPQPLKLSVPRRGLRTLLLLTCLSGGSLALTACAAQSPPAMTISIPPTLAAQCPRPPADAVATVGDLAAFSVRQEAALTVCNDRRQALVEIIQAHAEIVAPVKRPWWRFWKK